MDGGISRGERVLCLLTVGGLRYLGLVPMALNATVSSNIGNGADRLMPRL
jgi:hypothetical protein